MVGQAGSLLGTMDGMGNGVGTSGATGAGIMYHRGTPNDVLTGNVGSDIVFDIEGPDYYMCVAQGGSEWNRLISGT